MNLLIFDFEGTLVDFQWQLQAAMDEVRPLVREKTQSLDLDPKIIAEADYCHLYNYLLDHIADKRLRSEIISQIDVIFDFYDDDAALRWQLYPEVHNLLTGLQQAGWKIALDSNVGRRALDRMLEKFSLNQYFAPAISRDEVPRLKPASVGIDLIKSHFPEAKLADPKQIFLVGDSVTDIETARNAGIKVIILTNGEDKTERLQAHQPDYLIQNLIELTTILAST